MAWVLHTDGLTAFGLVTVFYYPILAIANYIPACEELLDWYWQLFVSE
jgi:hypothetical protein